VPVIAANGAGPCRRRRLARRLAAEVVVDPPLALLLLGEPDVEVGLKSLPREDAHGNVQPIRA
jgi:hypothetical protein